jgi:flagellar FliL protein
MVEEKERKEEHDGEEEVRPKKSFLKFIILSLVVLFFGAAGYMSWNFFIKGKSDAIQKEEVSKETEKPDVKKEEQPGIAYSLDPFIVNLMDKANVGKRYLKVKIVLEVGDKEDQETVNDHIPQLKDTILLLLSSQTFSDINTMEGKIELKQLLLSKMNQLLGKGTVDRLYFTEFVVQ